MNNFLDDKAIIEDYSEEILTLKCFLGVFVSVIILNLIKGYW